MLNHIFLPPHWSEEHDEKTIPILVYFLYNQNAWDNFGEEVRGTRKVKKNTGVVSSIENQSSDDCRPVLLI
jgi:hypothetical protein